MLLIHNWKVKIEEVLRTILWKLNREFASLDWYRIDEESIQIEEISGLEQILRGSFYKTSKLAIESGTRWISKSVTIA